jgi:hypothetical protein
VFEGAQVTAEFEMNGVPSPRPPSSGANPIVSYSTCQNIACASCEVPSRVQSLSLLQFKNQLSLEAEAADDLTTSFSPSPVLRITGDSLWEAVTCKLAECSVNMGNVIAEAKGGTASESRDTRGGSSDILVGREGTPRVIARQLTPEPGPEAREYEPRCDRQDVDSGYGAAASGEQIIARDSQGYMLRRRLKDVCITQNVNVQILQDVLASTIVDVLLAIAPQPWSDAPTQPYSSVNAKVMATIPHLCIVANDEYPERQPSFCQCRRAT